MTDSSDDFIENLILQGAMTISGIDEETGGFLYTFTDELKEVDPKFHEAMMEYFYEQLISLWQKGFISMDVTQENPVVGLTPKALDVLETESLTEDQRLHLKDIIDRLTQ